jgi:hypothetical protein
MMAGENENEDDILELGEAPENQDDTQPAAEGDDTLTGTDGEGQDDDEEIPTFGDPGEEGEQDTPLAKHLRAQIRDRDKRIAELDRSAKPEPAIVVGEEPTLESCDFDDERFKTELRAYDDRKRRADEQANKGNEAQRAADEQWEQEKAAFIKKRAALPYKDLDDVEAIVAASLEPAQSAMIVKCANDAPKLIYALGKNPAKLAALAGVKDPFKFIAAAVRLEGEVKMAKRKPTVEPDKIVRGSASMQSGDKARDKLIEKAQAGGDVTETLRALRQARKKQAA